MNINREKSVVTLTLSDIKIEELKKPRNLLHMSDVITYSVEEKRVLKKCIEVKLRLTGPGGFYSLMYLKQGGITPKKKHLIKRRVFNSKEI